MQALASLVFAVVPVGLYLWAIWLLDRYDREPIGLLVANFAWGAFGAIFFGIVFSIIASAAMSTSEFHDTIFVAPITEEITKGVFLFWTVRSRHFDNITDGVVYGMAIGLGFGMTENFLYFLGAGSATEWVVTVVIRTLFTAVMHAMSTGVFGAFVGYTKFGRPSLRLLFLPFGLLLAICIHFFWNISVSINNPGAFGLGLIFIVLSLIVIMVVMQFSLLAENRLIMHELAEEAEMGLIPALHLQYLPYTSKRKLLGWVSPVINKKQYIQLATRLAFRKHQSRYCREAVRDQYLEEIDGLRESITSVLAVDTVIDDEKVY